ncbi:unnamed protein product, partial [marine sediment metagenome]
PEWLKTAITLERLVMNMKALKGELPTGTDAEACAYMMTAAPTIINLAASVEKPSVQIRIASSRRSKSLARII